MRYLCLLIMVFSLRAHANPALPEFTRHDAAAWVNSKPLRVADLRGSVVFLDVWTFECWNCYRSFPWLNDLSAKIPALKMIGIHSPEFDRERDPAAVAAKAAEYGFKHPVMIDNDFAYWKALDNHYWPSFYLVDKRGMIRYRFAGETHNGDAQAQKIEAAVQVLLLERP
ncbi:redoxin domain-containing protein [Iodobacter sp. CM08]|uniref:redoxin family protein n=1 Tax=Iodobacter sp. CM08 TaxID=3085902 RepID=UPI0029818B1C|nr:redoxin family protein [Iodobacter sp. CM08]MDW5418576.1 redoxin domain-containing protein [Iodobacter sp. CM08]